MNPSACPAARLLDADRINLAAGHNVSRKFVYQQANKASAALAEVFSSSAPERAVNGHCGGNCASPPQRMKETVGGRWRGEVAQDFGGSNPEVNVKETIVRTSLSMAPTNGHLN